MQVCACVRVCRGACIYRENAKVIIYRLSQTFQFRRYAFTNEMNGIS